MERSNKTLCWNLAAKAVPVRILLTNRILTFPEHQHTQLEVQHKSRAIVLSRMNATGPSPSDRRDRRCLERESVKDILGIKVSVTASSKKRGPYTNRRVTALGARE